MTSIDDRTASRPIVIGVGNEFRGDDGIGAAVVVWLEVHGPRGLDLVVLDGEPARLLDAWAHRPLAVVVDAMRTGAASGSVSVVRVGQGIEDLPAWTRGQSSHDAGLADAVELAVTLGQRPQELVILGVEGVDFADGVGLSRPVRDAIDEVVRHVLDLLSAASVRSEALMTGGDDVPA